MKSETILSAAIAGFLFAGAANAFTPNDFSPSGPTVSAAYELLAKRGRGGDDRVPEPREPKEPIETECDDNGTDIVVCSVRAAA